jgi:hypothetical protein
MPELLIKIRAQVFFDKGRGSPRKMSSRQNPLTLIGRGLRRNSPGQQGLDFVQDQAFGMAYGKLGPVLAAQAGAFGQIPDFKIKFISVYNCFHNIPFFYPICRPIYQFDPESSIFGFFLDFFFGCEKIESKSNRLSQYRRVPC